MRREPTAPFLKEFGVAQRAGNRVGDPDGITHYSSGSVECKTCGGYLGNINQIARAIGVSPGSFSKWLRRQSVRQDIAERIRASFARVGE